MPSKHAGQRWLGVLLAVVLQSAIVHSFQTSGAVRCISCGLRASSSGEGGGEQDAVASSSSESSISPASVTMDDGGSDLTDRFKYKVHALMGTYDPPTGTVDDENQTGNIIGAMLQFPTEYTFSVVGKTVDNTLDGEDTAGDAYAEDVKRTLSSVLGSDAKMEIRVVPRGTKFTRVSAKVTVESASVISSIYEELDALEATVMKF